MDSKKIRTLAVSAAAVLLCFSTVFAGFMLKGHKPSELLETTTAQAVSAESYDLKNIPEYAGKPYVVINNNVPDFSKSMLKTKSYEKYGALDSLGRCTQCIACIGTDLMPTGERESISEIKPTGWQSIRYDFVDGESLYNRCHLIAHQLTGENANERNLITGTRYLNVDGMLEFEESTGNYVRETGNHVLYRVTPIFKGKELVARGVHMEAQSIEDNGKGIQFNVYCYNVQPRVIIDYKTGKARLESEKQTKDSGKKETYILNLNSKKFHKPDCDSVREISDSNKKTFKGSREDLIAGGYEPCGSCNP